MSEYYALWDITRGNLVEEFDSVDGALATVRWLSSNAGDQFAGMLCLTHERDDTPDDDEADVVAEQDELLRLAWGETKPQARIDVRVSGFDRLVRIMVGRSFGRGITVFNDPPILSASEWDAPSPNDVTARQVEPIVVGVA